MLFIIDISAGLFRLFGSTCRTLLNKETVIINSGYVDFYTASRLAQELQHCQQRNGDNKQDGEGIAQAVYNLASVLFE